VTNQPAGPFASGANVTVSVPVEKDAVNAVADCSSSGTDPEVAVLAVRFVPSKVTVMVPSWYGSTYVPA
jgi:hypothetical protein